VTNKHPERDPDHLRHALRCAGRVEELIAGGKAALFADEDKLDIADLAAKLDVILREIASISPAAPASGTTEDPPP
jgi:hypothetical protein